MRLCLSVLCMVVVLLSGACSSLKPSAGEGGVVDVVVSRPDRPGERSWTGKTVESLVAAHPSARMECFDRSGTRIDGPRAGEPGSVSIFAPDESGQDNFSFDAAGVIVRHQRSRGADYHAGVWKEVR